MQFTSPPALPQLPTRGQLPHKTNLQTPAGDPCVYKLHISSHSSRSPNDNMAASFAPSSVSFYPGMHAPSRPDPNNSSGSSKVRPSFYPPSPYPPIIDPDVRLALEELRSPYSIRLLCARLQSPDALHILPPIRESAIVR